MKLRDRFAAVNRLQRSRVFKLVATAVIVVAAIAAFSTYVVRQTAPVAVGGRAPAAEAPADGAELSDADRTVQSAMQATELAMRQVLRAQADWQSVAFGTGAVAAMAVAVVWLGLGLTYLALLGLAAVVGLPLAQFQATAEWGRLFLGMVALTASFTALLQVARLLLSHPGPVCSIARVVLDEAVRMKVSLVFIVLLIVGLSALPNSLDAAQPLRYRVQSFISFGTGLSFWTIAILTLLFSAATVTFEQRDKIIWQTVTKPVSAARYILGKWVGVCAVNAILLAVCASGIFLFIEYLRGQPALGERAAFVSEAGGEGDLTEDRWLLETQILTCHVSVGTTPPFTADSAEFLDGAARFIASRQEQDSSFATGAAQRRAVLDDLYRSAIVQYRSIEPGQAEGYRFDGLGWARDHQRLLTFRHRIDAGSNRPDRFYRVSFLFSDGTVLVQRMSGGHFHTATVFPSAVYTAQDEAEANADGQAERFDIAGSLGVQVVNGDVSTGASNPDTITFPPGGLEVTYALGSYRMNFLRATVILWGKLAFLAMVAICASTFLSFPVACMVAFGVFLAAEGSGYLAKSVEMFATVDREGNIQFFNLVASLITRGVAGAFGLYAGLQPTKKLVEGELIPISGVVMGGGFIAAATGALYLAAVVVFRRRELAMYSGR